MCPFSSPSGSDLPRFNGALHKLWRLLLPFATSSCFETCLDFSLTQEGLTTWDTETSGMRTSTRFVSRHPKKRLFVLSSNSFWRLKIHEGYENLRIHFQAPLQGFARLHVERAISVWFCVTRYFLRLKLYGLFRACVNYLGRFFCCSSTRYKKSLSLAPSTLKSFREIQHRMGPFLKSLWRHCIRRHSRTCTEW